MSKKIFKDTDGDIFVLDPKSIPLDVTYFNADDEETDTFWVTKEYFKHSLTEISYVDALGSVSDDLKRFLSRFILQQAPELSPFTPGFYLDGTPSPLGERLPLYVFESGNVSILDRYDRKPWTSHVQCLYGETTPSSYEEILAQTPAHHKESTRDWLDALRAPREEEAFTPGLYEDEDGDYFYMHEPWGEWVWYSFFIEPGGYSESWHIPKKWGSPISYMEALGDTSYPEAFKAWCQEICPELVVEKPKEEVFDPGFYTFCRSSRSLYYYTGETTWFVFAAGGPHEEASFYEVPSVHLPKAQKLTYEEALAALNGDADLLNIFVEDTDTWRKVWISSSGRVVVP